MKLTISWLWLVAPLAVLAATIPARAQEKNELGFSIGGAVVPSVTVDDVKTATRFFDFDSSFTFVFDYYHEFVHTKAVGVSGGVSIAVSPEDVIVSKGPDFGPRQYAYLFLTPEVKVKFSPERAIAPWLSFGGGWANYKEGKLLSGDPNTNSGSNGGALQFGGGLDVKTPFSLPLLRIPIGVRLAVRDYFASHPNYNVPVRGDYQNHILFTGGLVLHK